MNAYVKPTSGADTERDPYACAVCNCHHHATEQHAEPAWCDEAIWEDDEREAAFDAGWLPGDTR